MESKLRLLTNMAFWQSQIWREAVDSIYDLSTRSEPEPLPWWKEVWSLWRRSFRYDAVITEGVRTSMGFALARLLTGRRIPQIMTEVFIDDPRPDEFSWRIKVWWHGLLARRAAGIITNSSVETVTIAARYGLDPAKMKFVPLNTTIEKPFFSEKDEGYVFCGGRTLRDYTTLLMAARHIAAPVVIVCGKHDLEIVTQPLPTNVTIHREIPREAYLDLLSRCRVVALPLLPTERATGQVVMLEAMSMGKPVVTTRSPGTVDTIRHGENGFLVDEEDPAALTHQVNAVLRDHDLAHRIGHQALADVLENGTADGHARLKIEAITDSLA